MLGSHDDDYIAKSEDSTNRRGRPTFLPVLYSLIFPPTTSVCSIAFPWWGCLNFLKRELIFRNMLVATIGFLFCWLQNRRWCVGYLAERRPISPLIQKIGFGSHLNCRRQKKTPNGSKDFTIRLLFAALPFQLFLALYYVEMWNRIHHQPWIALLLLNPRVSRGL